YWTLDGHKNKTALLLLVPYDQRESARELISEMQARVGAFIQGQTFLGLVIGSLSFLAYSIIGLPYTLAL
ncbi:MAG: AI-2E family transporter, partial [Aliifodinibius sp.]|nr:AI-2E family transporter [Fodinibius sp.]